MITTILAIALGIWAPKDEPRFSSSAILDYERVTFTGVSIACGKGSIHINTSTGRVTFNNCEPDEAGKAFWKMVEKAFPDFKEQILKSRGPHTDLNPLFLNK